MLRALGNAFALLTVVPARYSEDVPADRMSSWFPLVGLVLGGGAWLAGRAIEGIANSEPLALVFSTLIVAVLAAVTRGMHWDAIADVSDGWWGGHTPERRREIASDSHTGAFGVAGIVFVALLQVASLASVLGSPLLAALPLLFALARLSAAIASWWGSPAKKQGLGASVSKRPEILSLGIAVLTLVGGIAITAYFTPASTALWVTLAAPFAASVGLPFVIARRFGGTTGDVMGASIILVETLGLASLAILGGLL